MGWPFFLPADPLRLADTPPHLETVGGGGEYPPAKNSQHLLKQREIIHLPSSSESC
jgi:hypothetical protein